MEGRHLRAVGEGPPGATGAATGDDDALWTSRERLAHIRTFARARMCPPWSVLGVVLARIVVATPPFVVLPPLVGSHASLNLFVGLVAPSGGGKGASEACAAEAMIVTGPHGEPLEQSTVGSGEGIPHLYGHREGRDVVRHRSAVLFTIPEVDNLTALGQRQGATLLPQLRQAWSGEKLGFAYADPTKAIPIDRHTYRMGLVLGVQPLRAGQLLGDADGGTPQRFVWLPASDPQAPDRPPAEPAAVDWQSPWPATFGKPFGVMEVPPVAEEYIRLRRLEVNRGLGNPLDAHGPLAQLKVAAALALLEERQGINERDWELAGYVMAISSTTRRAVEAELAQQAAVSNVARGRAEADRAVVVEDSKAEASTVRVAKRVAAIVRERGEMPGGALRSALSSRDRAWFAEAVERAVAAGTLVAAPIPGQGQPGVSYRTAA